MLEWVFLMILFPSARQIQQNLNTRCKFCDDQQSLESENLSLPAQAESVLPDPPGSPGSSLGLVVAPAMTKTSGPLTSSSQTSQLTMLVDSVHDPVDLRISSDALVRHVHHDHLEIFVGRVLSNPITVEDPQPLESATNTLLSDGLKVSLRLLLLDSTRALGFTIGTSLGHRPLATSTSHGNAVDDEALLGLVSKSASPVRAGGTRSTMNLRAKNILYQSYIYVLVLPW